MFSFQFSGILGSICSLFRFTVMTNLQSVVLKTEVAVGSRTLSSLWVRVEQESDHTELGLWFILG